MKRKKAKPKIKTIPWDSAAYLKTDRDIAYYLEAVFEDGDPALISHALGVIARAKGMTQIAQTAGLGRESLYVHVEVPIKRAGGVHQQRGLSRLAREAEDLCHASGRRCGEARPAADH